MSACHRVPKGALEATWVQLLRAGHRVEHVVIDGDDAVFLVSENPMTVRATVADHRYGTGAEIGKRLGSGA